MATDKSSKSPKLDEALSRSKIARFWFLGLAPVLTEVVLSTSSLTMPKFLSFCQVVPGVEDVPPPPPVAPSTDLQSPLWSAERSLNVRGRRSSENSKFAGEGISIRRSRTSDPFSQRTQIDNKRASDSSGRCKGLSPLSEPLGFGLSRYEQEFEEITPLGQGGFGSVMKCCLRSSSALRSNEFYAVKRICLINDETVNAVVLREASNAAQLSHRNIVRYFSAWIDTFEEPVARKLTSSSFRVSLPVASLGSSIPSSLMGFGVRCIPRSTSNPVLLRADEIPPPKRYLFIQMEYIAGKTLTGLIAENELHRKPSWIWAIFRQILEALWYMHGNGLIHRDLKPCNIFIQNEPECNTSQVPVTVKLGDFGLSTFVLSDSPQQFVTGIRDVGELSAGVGTKWYMAPEQEKGGAYNFAVDVFALGVVLFEMWHPPFSTLMERITVLSNVVRHLKFPAGFESRTPPNVISLLESMLSHSPQTRPSAEQLLSSNHIPFAGSVLFRHVYGLIAHQKLSSEKMQLMATLFTKPVSKAKAEEAFFDGIKIEPKAALMASHVTHHCRKVFAGCNAVPVAAPILVPVIGTNESGVRLTSQLGAWIDPENALAYRLNLRQSVSPGIQIASEPAMCGPLDDALTASRVIDAAGTQLAFPSDFDYGFSLLPVDLHSGTISSRYSIASVYRKTNTDRRIFDNQSASGDIYPMGRLWAIYEVTWALSLEQLTEPPTKSVAAIMEADTMVTAWHIVQPFSRWTGCLDLIWTHGQLFRAILHEVCGIPQNRLNEMEDFLFSPSLSRSSFCSKIQALQSHLGRNDQAMDVGERTWALLCLDLDPIAFVFELGAILGRSGDTLLCTRKVATEDLNMKFSEANSRHCLAPPGPKIMQGIFPVVTSCIKHIEAIAELLESSEIPSRFTLRMHLTAYTRSVISTIGFMIAVDNSVTVTALSGRGNSSGFWDVLCAGVTRGDEKNNDLLVGRLPDVPTRRVVLEMALHKLVDLLATVDDDVLATWTESFSATTKDGAPIRHPLLRFSRSWRDLVAQPKIIIFVTDSELQPHAVILKRCLSRLGISVERRIDRVVDAGRLRKLLKRHGIEWAVHIRAHSGATDKESLRFKIHSLQSYMKDAQSAQEPVFLDTRSVVDFFRSQYSR